LLSQTNKTLTKITSGLLKWPGKNKYSKIHRLDLLIWPTNKNTIPITQNTIDPISKVAYLE